MTTVLELMDVSKRFKDVLAVEHLSLSVNRGEIFAFLGLNGAGKTTTIKMILGLLQPTQGSIALLGKQNPVARDRVRIGYMPEIAYYYPYLTLEELLRFYGGLCGMTSRECDRQADQLIPKLGLQTARKRQLKTYSKGMLQRAGIAQALLHDPELLILDEPFTGLDPLARVHLRNLILELKSQGKSIFLSSHELSEAEIICDHVAIMNQGKCILKGAMQELVGTKETNLERLFLDVLKEKKVQP